jgi:ketosteroid isomerase-like protein
MRQFRPKLATTFLVMCIIGLTFAQEATNTGASDSAGAEQQVKQLEQQIRSQVVKGDTSGLQQYLTDDSVIIGADGTMSNKNQSIADIRTGKVKYSSIDVKEERVRTYGDTAIFNGLATVKLTIDGQDRSGDYRVTIVWVKQNGQWKRASFQATRVQTATTGRMIQVDENP